MTRDQVITVVDELDNRGLIRKGKVTGQWHTIHCPFHSNGQERKPSCGVLLEDQYRNGHMYPAGMMNCLACHYSGDAIKWIQDLLKLKGMSGTGQEWLETNVPGFKMNSSDIESLLPSGLMNDLVNKYAAENLRMRTTSSSLRYIQEEELASYRFTVPYMYERRLTDAVIEKYDVGFDANFPHDKKKKSPCVTFPVKDSLGNTLFIARRTIEGKFWNYPPNVAKPVYGVYELPKDAKSVIICESIFNVLTAVVYGYNAVALLGTSNVMQMDQLKKLGVREFVLCFDGDEAGRKAEERVRRALTGHAVLWTIHMPDGKDLNDCDKETFDKLYAERD